MSDAAQATPVPNQPLPRFNVEPYRPDGGADLPGIMMLIGALAVVGAILGFVAHFVSQWFYLIILFPVLIGLALGIVGVRMVKQGRVRNPWIGGLAGLLGGVLAMLAMHYFDARSFRNTIAEEQPDFIAFANAPESERAAILRDDLTEGERAAIDAEVDAVRGGVWDYLNYAATEGVTISKATSGSDKGINLGYTGSWIYWLIETGIVAGITFAMIRASTAEPYCRDCGDWKSPRTLGTLSTDPATATAALQSGDLERVRGAAPSADFTSPLVVTAANCNQCVGAALVDVKLENLSTNAKGKVERKTLAHVTYPGEAMPHLAALFTPPPPAPLQPLPAV